MLGQIFLIKQAFLQTLYYIYNAKIPKRDPRYEWNKILPGESKQTLWYEYIPFDRLPQVYDPLEGFFQNCNSHGKA